MEDHLVAVVKKVERAEGRSGKPYYKVSAIKKDGNWFNGTSFDADFMKPDVHGREIEFTFTTKQVGNNTYYNIQRWSFTGNQPSQQQAKAAPQQSQSFGNRDEQIVRQSALHQAVALYPHLVAQGAVPWPKSGKGAKAAEDHRVVVEFLFEIAKKIRDRVLDEDWSVQQEEESTEYQEDDIPF